VQRRRAFSQGAPKTTIVNEKVIPSKLPAVLFDRYWSVIYPGSTAVHTILSLSGRIDEERLARAVRLSLDAEPILGSRFVERWFRPYWHRLNDFDNEEFCEVRASADCEADARHFLEVLPDRPLRVLLLRGDSQLLLCIKLDHRVGDGKAVQEYAYLLVDIYNRLETNPNYQPVPNVTGDRSLRLIGNEFGLEEKWRIFRHISKVNREISKLGKWHYPVTRDGRVDYVSWRLDVDQVNAIFQFGCRHRATVSQVLLAAFYLAAYEALPHSTGVPLPVSTTVDLRRYLPENKASALGNFVGASVIAVDPRSGNSIDAVLPQIRNQMKSQQKYFGLAGSLFAAEGLPLVQHLVGLVPYGPIKRSNQRRLERLSAEDYVPGMLLVSNAGELDAERLVLAGTEVTNAFTTAGVSRIPGLLGLGVSAFKGSLTLYLGIASTNLVNRVSERMMQLLPARPHVSPTAAGI
jgi:NRPS condensation-like uncharacterized protein